MQAIGSMEGSSTAQTATLLTSPVLYRFSPSIAVQALATVTVRPSMLPRNESRKVVSPTLSVTSLTALSSRENPYMARVISWMSPSR